MTERGRQAVGATWGFALSERGACWRVRAERGPRGALRWCARQGQWQRVGTKPGSLRTRWRQAGKRRGCPVRGGSPAAPWQQRQREAARPRRCFKVEPRSNYSVRFSLSGILPDVDERKVPLPRPRGTMFTVAITQLAPQGPRLRGLTSERPGECSVPEVAPDPRTPEPRSRCVFHDLRMFLPLRFLLRMRPRGAHPAGPA